MRHDNLTTTKLQGEFAQWLAYNVDRNVCALSGKGSLHAMGIVCLFTSPSGKMPLQTSLLKMEKVQSFKEIIKNKGVIIREYLPPSIAGLSTVPFEELEVYC